MLPEPVSKLLVTALCRIKEIIIPYTWPSGRAFRWKLYLSKQMSRISLKGKYLKNIHFFLLFIFIFLLLFVSGKWNFNVWCRLSITTYNAALLIIGSGEIILFFGVYCHSPEIHLSGKSDLFTHTVPEMCTLSRTKGINPTLLCTLLVSGDPTDGFGL